MDEILLQQWLQWLGCGTALSGAALLALNCRVSGWGFVLFLISNGFWLAFGWVTVGLMGTLGLSLPGRQLVAYILEIGRAHV